VKILKFHKNKISFNSDYYLTKTAFILEGEQGYFYHSGLNEMRASQRPDVIEWMLRQAAQDTGKVRVGCLRLIIRHVEGEQRLAWSSSINM
jgi:hypothetical protein